MFINNIKTDWGTLCLAWWCFRSEFLNVLFAAMIEILCLIRLFTSLLGRGWDTVSEPMRTLLHSANIYLHSANI